MKQFTLDISIAPSGAVTGYVTTKGDEWPGEGLCIGYIGETTDGGLVIILARKPTQGEIAP